MKKYIRTKDGNIYQRFFKDKSIRGVGGGGCCDQNLNPIGETVIQESDTIEELCDKFVLISELEKRIIKPKELNKDCEGWTKEIGIPEGIIKVYGAIWTDRGLIYVAKMNEKGELELL